MKLFSKLLITTSLITSSLLANAMDEKVIEFEENRISKNPNLKLNDVTVHSKKELPLAGWYGYILNVDVEVQNKNMKIKDILLSNGEYVTLEMFDAQTNQSLKSLVTIDLSDDYHDEKKLIAGNHNAKDKIVVFSDPLCPFCKSYIPKLIEYVNKNKNSVALYYYHFPLLSIHPSAGPLSKIMETNEAKSIKDIKLKVYRANWENHFNPKETNPQIILNAFNKMFNTNIKLSEISTSDINNIINKDKKMGEDVMVNGTPTVFINKKRDDTKTEYLDLGKK